MDPVSETLLSRPRVEGQERVPSALPPESPLGMPVQSLRERGEWPRGVPQTAPPSAGLRRALVIGGAIALTAWGSWEMYEVLVVGGLTPLETLILILFVVLFAWLALAGTNAMAGFFAVVGQRSAGLGIALDGPLPELSHRTALLMPTYNEAPERVFSGLEAICESLLATGRAENFDVFILSDTTDADTWVAEEAAWMALAERMRGRVSVYYRRRAKNIERKAGNIADWVRRFGGAYEGMLILDADSLMTGEVIVRITAALEQHPGVGLVQTLPAIVNGRSLFARSQQFASRLYGPLIAAGLAWWHGADSNYWGHNAVIRTRAFASAAGLPHLKGRKPFGGHILSHDFVEAALIRRAGWAVHMVPALEGSYEESPPSITELGIRDRRWCQGNLQHIAVLTARGLSPISRIHLLMGIGSYITAPLWFASLVVGMLASLQAAYVRPEYFPEGFSLFPQWPAQDPVRALYLFAATMLILLLPKLLSLLSLLFRPGVRLAFGGFIRALFGVLLETLVSVLIAPIMMVVQSIAVVEILIGKDAGWQPQQRDDGTVPLGQLVWRYGPYMILGCLMAAAALLVSLPLFLWMLPVTLGLMLAVPVAALTASSSLGRASGRMGLLTIPEERRAPDILTRFEVLASAARSAAAVTTGVERLAGDARLLALHRALLPEPRGRGVMPVDADLEIGLVKLGEADRLEAARTWLSRKEYAATLADARGLEQWMRLARA